MAVALRDIYGNPSSTHSAGQLARQHLETARNIIARYLDASPRELVFTSGGTEADNLAILGLVRHLPGERKHIVTTAIEHPAVLESCRQLEKEGADVTYAGVNRDGLVDVDELERSLRPETVLVSVMHANNETGTIQPAREIADLVRKRREAGQTIFFHSDGVQAFGKIEIGVQSLGVDLYSMSAHKIFAPKGTGALYVRKGTPAHGIQFGGRHERDRRAGTENVPGAVAFARAVELCAAWNQSSVATLRDRFENEVLSRIPTVEINGAVNNRLPNTSNLLFRGISAETLLIALDMKGIAVSTGAACSSGSVEASHVLLAMGRTREEAKSSVRFSLGRSNTAEDVNTLIEAVTTSTSKLRSANRLEKSFAV